MVITLVTVQTIMGLLSTFKTNRFFLKIIFILGLSALSCGSKQDSAASAKEAIQQYLECKNKKDTGCIFRLLPKTLITTARDTATDINAVKAKIKDRKTLLSLAKQAYLNKDALQIKSGNDVLFYAMRLQTTKDSGLVGDVRHAVRKINHSKKEDVYIVLTYGGERYNIKHDVNNQYRVVPQNKVIRRINKLSASASLLRILADKSRSPKPKSK